MEMASGGEREVARGARAEGGEVSDGKKDEREVGRLAVLTNELEKGKRTRLGRPQLRRAQRAPCLLSNGRYSGTEGTRRGVESISFSLTGNAADCPMTEMPSSAWPASTRWHWN